MSKAGHTYKKIVFTIPFQFPYVYGGDISDSFGPASQGSPSLAAYKVKRWSHKVNPCPYALLGHMNVTKATAGELPGWLWFPLAKSVVCWGCQNRDPRRSADGAYISKVVVSDETTPLSILLTSN